MRWFWQSRCWVRAPAAGLRIGVSGPLGCTAGIAVVKALSKQVQQRVAHPKENDLDCFPGYCRDTNDGSPKPTSVAGYHCDAIDRSDVSIYLFIVCQRGNRYVSAFAADDE